MAVSHLAVEGSVLYPTLHLRHRLLPGDGPGGVPAISGVSARYDRPLCPPVYLLKVIILAADSAGDCVLR